MSLIKTQDICHLFWYSWNHSERNLNFMMIPNLHLLFNICCSSSCSSLHVRFSLKFWSIGHLMSCASLSDFAPASSSLEHPHYMHNGQLPDAFIAQTKPGNSSASRRVWLILIHSWAGSSSPSWVSVAIQLALMSHTTSHHALCTQHTSSASSTQQINTEGCLITRLIALNT